MIGRHFYHESVKAAVAVMGSLFNNLVVKRRDGKLLPVPISYGPRQKWLEAQKGLKPEEEMFEKLLPRMSYELVAMQYDINRKLTNKNTMIRTPDTLGVPRQRTQVPVPYNLNFSLYLETKTLNDGWQILEQILPFFTPAYTVKVRHFPADADSETPLPTNDYDMPITLQAVTWADDWTGEIADRRTVEWTLEFETKIYLHGPVAQSTVIYDSRIGISTAGEKDLNTLTRGDSELLGVETGYVHIEDSDAVFDSDSKYSPSVLNLSDSDGNIVKIVRDINL
jgi:hypothetical protein